MIDHIRNLSAAFVQAVLAQSLGSAEPANALLYCGPASKTGRYSLSERRHLASPYCLEHGPADSSHNDCASDLISDDQGGDDPACLADRACLHGASFP